MKPPVGRLSGAPLLQRGALPYWTSGRLSQSHFPLLDLLVPYLGTVLVPYQHVPACFPAVELARVAIASPAFQIPSATQRFAVGPSRYRHVLFQHNRNLIRGCGGDLHTAAACSV